MPWGSLSEDRKVLSHSMERQFGPEIESWDSPGRQSPLKRTPSLPVPALCPGPRGRATISVEFVLRLSKKDPHGPSVQ